MIRHRSTQMLRESVESGVCGAKLHLGGRFRRGNRGSAGFAALFALDCGFSGLEADLGMCAVAEGFVDAAAAAAQRNTGLAGEVVVVAVSIHELELAEVAFHAEGAVALCGDLDVCHAVVLSSKSL